jgi:predicted O-methyltransferase YrrM
MTQPLDPGKILQTGLGFWPSKTLLAAVQLRVFSVLAAGPMTGEELGAKTGVQPRLVFDFFDSLVALGFLERDGDGAAARYRNTPETALFLDAASPRYVGGILEMANARLYRFWGDLEEGLRTGRAQNEQKHEGRPIFEALYADPARLEQFLQAMAGISAGNFETFADRFDFSRAKTLVDVGGATGQLSILVAKRHPHMTCTSCDLAVVEPVAKKTIAAAGVADRVKTQALDFFKDEIPKADVVTMGMILHDWNLDVKRMLVKKAYDALPEGGAFVVIENLIDDARRTNAFGLMMSLNMLIETGDGFDYSGKDFAGWCREAGFRKVETMHLAGPASAGIAWK